MFSIIIPTLNEERFVTRLLTSLVNQTYKDFEVIISDGGSADKTIARARIFEKHFPVRIALENDQSQKGPSRGRNMGASVAKGDWLVFIDADGIAFPYMLERLAAYVRSHNPSFATSWFATDGETSADALFGIIANVYTELSIIMKKPLASGVFTAVKKQVFDGVGGYDEHIYFGEDYDITQRIVNAGYPLSIIRETLIQWSLRRIKKKGKLYFFHSYAVATIMTLLVTKKYFKYLPGYQLGGHLYDQLLHSEKDTVINRFNRKVKELMKELVNRV